MNSINIIIPTRNRLEMLLRTLDSIPKFDFISITVICDGDMSTYQYLLDNADREIASFFIPGHHGTVFCRNSVMHDTTDGVLCATDSVIFQPNAIQDALSVFNSSFLDDDGVFCFRFDGIGSCTAIPLVGKKFLERYENKKLFCPSYFHFACQEISSLCILLREKHKRNFLVIDENKSIQKIMCCDATYNDARMYKGVDMKLKCDRESKNIVWGWHHDA